MADEVITTVQLVAESGITYRQADYWSRIGLLRPRIGLEPGRGQGGVYREWDAGELRVARLMGLLTAAGITPRTAERIARSPGGRYELGPGIWIQVDEHRECRHCGAPIRRCPDAHAVSADYPLCKGWRHIGYDDQPVIGHCCGGRSINPSAEPEAGNPVAGEREDGKHGR